MYVFDVCRRRTDASLVSNTIGLVSVSAKKIDSQYYYWGSTDDGYPLPLFLLNQWNNYFRNNDATFNKLYGNQYTNSKLTTMEKLDQFYVNARIFWPFSGISIKSSPTVVQAAIVGQFVVGGSSKTKKDATTTVSIDSTKSERANKDDNPLFFDAASSALLLVQNPHDSPNFWRYEHAYFPLTRKSPGTYQWFAVTDSRGNSYVDNTSDKEPAFVYIMGSYDPKSSTSTPNDNSYDFFAVDSADTYQVIGRLSAVNFAEFKFDAFEILCDDSTWQLLYDEGSSDNVKGKGKGKKGPTSTSSSKSITPKALFGPLVTEASFNYDPVSSKWLVVSLKPPDTRVQVCSAEAVESVWTCEFVADVTKPWSDTKKFLTYAAKNHPELSLSSPNPNDKVKLKSFSRSVNVTQSHLDNIDLVVSVIPNSAGKIGLLFEDSEIGVTSYTPKFISVKASVKS